MISETHGAKRVGNPRSVVPTTGAVELLESSRTNLFSLLDRPPNDSDGFIYWHR